MSEDHKTQRPPYVPWGTYHKFITDLDEAPLPTFIDKSLMPTMSGGMQSILLAALKSTKMIDSGGVPTNRLGEFLASGEADRKRLIVRALEDSYPFLFDGEIDLSRTTPGHFDKELREKGGLSGSTLDKAANFFLSAAEYAEIPLSTHLKARKPSGRKSTGNSRKPKPASKAETTEQQKTVLDGASIPPQAPITELALEYRLVDLLTEAQSDQEAFQAILKVITFLKTKPNRDSVSDADAE